MERVANILEQGGECIEHLVYNQTIALTTGLLHPMSFLGFTLPLGVWGQLADRPMRDSIKSEITSSISTLQNDTKSRDNTIKDIVQSMRSALEYQVGRALPPLDTILLRPPDKVSVDFGTVRYGFGGNVWWEESLASAL